MNANAQQNVSLFDIVKWLLVIVIIGIGVFGNSYFAEDYSPLYRALALIGLALVALALAYTTEKGKAFLELLKESRTEARKVVWPSRAETNQSTLIVAVVVAIMSVVLLGLDSLLSWIVKLLLG